MPKGPDTVSSSFSYEEIRLAAMTEQSDASDHHEDKMKPRLAIDVAKLGCSALRSDGNLVDNLESRTALRSEAEVLRLTSRTRECMRTRNIYPIRSKF